MTNLFPRTEDRITALEEANGQLTDKLIKLEKEVSELQKPVKVECHLQGTAPELTENSPRELSPKPYELHTRVDSSTLISGTHLRIGFYDNASNFCIVGCIYDSGECYILSTYDVIENYDLWREKGMLVCSNPVEWRGKKYWIDSEFVITSSDCNNGGIYDFDYCYADAMCHDTNIIRHKHNNRPILF